jgi:putative MATE family efflux protein
LNKNMIEERHSLMINQPIVRVILKVAVPSIISMLVASIYNLVDTMFVSMLSTQASAAAGIVFPLMSIMQACGLTFGIGAASYISRLLGQKKTEQANRVVGTAFFTSVFFGIIIMILCFAYLDPILILFGSTQTILPYAHEYAFYILFGSPIMAGSMVLDATLRSEGSALRALVGISSGAVLNIILDPIFIFTLNMGVGGAALATTISQLVGLGVLASNYIRKATLLSLSVRFFTFSKKIYSELFRIGFPAFIRVALQSVAVVMLNNAANPYGDSAIAAISIVGRIIWLFVSALIGFGQGYQPVAGFNYGAGRMDRVWKSYRFALTAGISFMVFCAGITALFAPHIMHIFRPDDAEAIRIGTQVLYAQCVSMPLIGLIIISNMLFQAMGAGLSAAILAVSRQGLFFIPIILIVPIFLKLDGVIISQMLADICSFILAIILVTRFALKNKKKAPAAIREAAEHI